MAGLLERFAKVQKELKAPKNQYNSFGKYAYRSAEDIIEAAKPLCIENGLILMIGDSIEEIGGLLFVKATASVYDIEGNTNDENGGVISRSAYAEIEKESRNGENAPQRTGMASSYARKYALNGLFAIDDVKDADATNDHGKGQQKGVGKAYQRPKVYRNGKTKAQAKETAEKGTDELMRAKARLAHAIDAWAARTGADAGKSKAGVMQRPDYNAESVEYFERVAEEFEASLAEMVASEQHA